MERQINVKTSQTLLDYVASVKEDVTKIPGLLKSNFNIYENSQQFQSLFFCLMFASTSYKASLTELQEESESLQSICAKALTDKDVAWKCEDCEMDPTCIICVECFEKSNHEGHRVRLQRGAAGCCDCGDTTAWRPTGFCSDHQGYADYTDEQVDELLGQDVGMRVRILFKALGEFLHDSLLKLDQDLDEADEEAKKDRVKLENRILSAVGCISNCLQYTPLFIHYFTKMFAAVYPYCDKTTHQCSTLAYIDDEQRHDCEKSLEGINVVIEETEEPKECTCTLICHFFKIKNISLQKFFIDNIVFKMFQSLRFKTLLGLTYVSTYDQLLDMSHIDDSFIHLGVQILTIPEISLKILQDSSLRGIFWDKFCALSAMKKEESFAKRRAFFWTISDWKYLIKEPTIEYLLATNIIGDFIDLFTKLCMIDAVENRSQHIFFSSEGYFTESIDYHYLALKISFTLVKEINYYDLEFNRNLATLFYKRITGLEKWWEENHNYKGFIQIPLLRIFSLWLSRYLLNNLVVNDDQLRSNSVSDVPKYRDILRKLVSELFNDLTEVQIEHLFTMAVKVTGRSMGFNDEIRSQKWVNLGLEITALPRLTSDNLSYYFNDPDAILVQMLFLLTDNPSLLMKSFLGGYSIDGHMSGIYTGLVYNPSEYKLDCKDNAHKEVSNLKLFLYFINSLMVDDRTILYQWRPYNEFQVIGKDENINHRIQKYFEKIANYEAIHILVRMSGSSIKNILSRAPKQMAESPEFEKELNSHARCTTSREGKKIFSIDPKYMSHFNSFWYKNLHEHSEAMKNYEEFYKMQAKSETKSKAQDHNPLKISNCSLGFFVGGIRENLLRTEIPQFLINLMQYKNEFAFIDKDIEDYAAQVLKLSLSYTLELKKEQKDHDLVLKIHNLITEEKKFFSDLKDNGAYPELTDVYFKLSEESSEISIETQEAQKDKEKSKMDKKKMMQKRKAMAMKKMALKRTKIIEKCGLETETSCDSGSLVSDKGEDEVPKCQKCYESLNPDSFSENPYGHLVAVIKTKLYIHSCEQTFYNQKKLHLNLFSTEEQKNLEKLEFDSSGFENINFLDNGNAGLVMKTCRHLIHYDCLNSFKLQNSENRAATLLIEDYNLNEFSCPLCKQYSNSIIPPLKELKKLIEDGSLSSITEEYKNVLLTMMLDLINVSREKLVEEKDKKDILIVDLEEKKDDIVRTANNFINHCIQLTDVKSLSWILSEAPKIKSLLLIGRVLVSPNNEKQLIELNLPKIELNKTPIFKTNVTAKVVETLLYLYYKQISEGKTLEVEAMLTLLKQGYSLILFQIAAAVIYEKHGFSIKDTASILSFNSLKSMIKDMNAKLTIGGQSIDTESRFIEGSLSYLRKATAILYMISEAGQGHHSEIKKLSNSKFGCEQATELSMLLNIIGWEIEEGEEKFNFYKIITDVEELPLQEEYGLRELKEYFNEQLGLNQMEVDPVETTKQASNKDISMEEEKIDPNETVVEVKKKVIDPNLIPTALYLITPDYYFTLPKLCSTLENLTKEYYKIDCSLCHKISKRGTICLTCQEYMCVAKCGLSASNKDYLIGNLTRHSKDCGAKCSIFIGPVEGQLIYLYDGLAIEAKSPYCDKYGECFDEREKRYETYTLNNDQYNEVRQHLLDFEIPNYVINKRASKTKVYRQHVL